MPCYSRQTSTVEFGQGTDAALLAKGLEALGYITGRAGQVLRFSHPETGAIGTYQAGRLTIDAAIDQNEIKRAYSAEVIKSAAQRFGWKANQTSATQFQVTRRV